MVHDWIVRGGPLMWPIVGVSVLGLMIILERSFFWMRHAWGGDAQGRHVVYTERATPHPEAARSSDPVVRVACWNRISPLQGRVMADQAIALGRRGLGTLELLASLSTSLGLFGTVVGVSMSFHAISSADSGAVVSGLGVALFTTVLGLVVHLYCSVFAAFFSYLSDRMEGEIQRVLDCTAPQTPAEGAAR